MQYLLNVLVKILIKVTPSFKTYKFFLVIKPVLSNVVARISEAIFIKSSDASQKYFRDKTMCCEMSLEKPLLDQKATR